MENVANDPAPTGVELPATPPRRRTALEGLLEVPADADAAELRDLATRQAAALRREDEVHRVLVQVVLGGGSLDALCAHVAGLLDASVVVTTTDGRVVAEAGTAAGLQAARSSGAFDRTGRLVVEREPIGERARERAGERAGVRAGEPAWLRRALVQIVAGSVEEGRLAAFTTDRELGPTDIHLLERAATVAALALAREQAVSAVESKYRAEFLRDALAGRAGADHEALTHAESLGWRVASRFVVVAAETDEDDTATTRSGEEVRTLQQRFTRAWVRAVGARDPYAPVMGFSQEVVALLPVAADADTDQVMAQVAEIAGVVRGDGGGGRRTFSTGVSRVVTSMSGLPAAYDEALKAVAVGRQVHGDSALTHVDGLGIYRLLALVPDSADLRRFVTDALGPLATDDVAEHADLRRTLEVLIDTNLNVAETSRVLFFHYNTLRYRIAKLERMLGPFTTDPQLRLTLALALKVLQMRGLKR